MTDFPIRRHGLGGSVSVTISLSPFITDWTKASSVFVSCIFSGSKYIPTAHASHFDTFMPESIGDRFCRYRWPGTMTTIVLRSESLDFHFPDASTDSHYEIIRETVRSIAGYILRELINYGKYSYSVVVNSHGEFIQHTLLEYFPEGDSKNSNGNNDTFEQLSLHGMIFRDKTNGRALRRMIERSELIENGLFVSTVISAVDTVLKIDDEIAWIDKMVEAADLRTCLVYLP